MKKTKKIKYEKCVMHHLILPCDYCTIEQQVDDENEKKRENNSIW